MNVSAMRRVLCVLLLTTVASVAGAASDPIDEEHATVITPDKAEKSAAVTLYRDSEGQYVHFYRMNVRKETPYTVWIEGMSDPSVTIVAVNAEFSFEVDPPLAVFSETAYGDEVRWSLTGKEEWAINWDFNGLGQDAPAGFDLGMDDDFDFGGKTPDTWNYYIKITGKKGATATLKYVKANKMPVGVSQNPMTIKPKADAQTTDWLDFKSSDFYLKADLKGGCRYHFGSMKGSADNLLSIRSMESQGFFVRDEAWSSDVSGAVVFIPDADGTYEIVIHSTKGYGARAKFRYRVDPARSVADHPMVTLKAEEKPLTCKPGYLNDPASGAYDNIVDQELFKFTAYHKKYVIDTIGAETDLVLYLYDAKGRLVGENRSKGNGSKDVRITIDTEKTEVFYIGICEDIPLGSDKVPSRKPVAVSARIVEEATDWQAVLLPAPAMFGDRPSVIDPAGTASVTLGADCWYATYTFNGRAGITYAFEAVAQGSTEAAGELFATVYTLSGETMKVKETFTFRDGEPIAFEPETSAVYYLRIESANGYGTDYPAFRLHSIGSLASGEACGALRIVPQGAAGRWSVDGESLKYQSGDTILLAEGQHKIVFRSVTGFTRPGDEVVTIEKDKLLMFTDVYYTDAFDPTDDKDRGATPWALTTSETHQTEHTLWPVDKYDRYAITAKDGRCYSFRLHDNVGDQVFFIKAPDGTYLTDPATSVDRLSLPTSDQPYILIVQHGTAGKSGGKYELSGYYDSVGVVKFSASTVDAKDTDPSVTLTVTRNSTKGALRVKYETVEGTAKKGQQFFAQEGHLEWASGDKTSRPITIRLIPKMLPLKGDALKFQVKLTDAATPGCYGTIFPGCAKSTSATVKIANTGTYKSVKSAYESVYTDKKATVVTETVPLRGGTFYGLVSDAGSHGSGATEFAAVTLTVSAGSKISKDKISVSVSACGSKYSFSKTGWGAEDDAGRVIKTIKTTRTIGTQSVTDTIKLTVQDGSNAKYAWRNAKGDVELTLNLADPDGGVRVVKYAGVIYRQNAGIQDYLSKVFAYDGYYTVALVPGDAHAWDGGKAGDWVPAGNGYLTLTMSNLGKAKVAGLLPDGTKVSASVAACAAVLDDASGNGNSILIPVYSANADYCFAATLKLLRQADASGRPDGKDYKLVVDSASPVYWSNRNPAKTAGGQQGWYQTLKAVGGWYDKLVNLQAYYNDRTHEFAVKSATGADISDFPKEMLYDGYTFITTEPKAAPDGLAVDLGGNVFATATKVLVTAPEGGYDFVKSANPCEVKLDFARATGVLTGSLKLWQEKEDTGAQKVVKGFSTFGVLTLDRADAADPGHPVISERELISGSMIRSVETDGRTWTFSSPFNIIGVEADD